MQGHVRFSRAHGNPAGVFPALGFAARFRKNCENKTLWLLGIPPKLIEHYFGRLHTARNRGNNLPSAKPLGAQCLFKNTLICAPFILSPANSHTLSLSLPLAVRNVCIDCCINFPISVATCMVDMLRSPPLTRVRNSEVCYKVSCRYSILLHAHVQDVHP